MKLRFMPLLKRKKSDIGVCLIFIRQKIIESQNLTGFVFPNQAKHTSDNHKAFVRYSLVRILVTRKIKNIFRFIVNLPKIGSKVRNFPSEPKFSSRDESLENWLGGKIDFWAH